MQHRGGRSARAHGSKSWVTLHANMYILIITKGGYGLYCIGDACMDTQFFAFLSELTSQPLINFIHVTFWIISRKSKLCSLCSYKNNKAQ